MLEARSQKLDVADCSDMWEGALRNGCEMPSYHASLAYTVC